MSLPNLPYTPRIRSGDVIDFRGLDRTDAASPGELADSLNLSTVRYPALSPRTKRTRLEDYENVTDAFEWDGRIMTVVPNGVDDEGAKLYSSDQTSAVCSVTNGLKQWAVVSGRLCIFPDKIIVDDIGAATLRVRYPEADADLTDANMGTVKITDSRITATPTGNVGDTTPIFKDVFSVGDAVSLTGTLEGISDFEHAVVRDIDETANALIFDDNTIRVAAAYVKTAVALPAEGETDVRLRYSDFDYVFTPSETLPIGVILYVAKAATAAGSATVYAFSGGVVRDSYTATVEATAVSDPPEAISLTKYKPTTGGTADAHVKRTVPDLEFICESGNRLWGLDVDNNTICVSALGDPFNFFVFDGVDTDSYQLAVGSEGEWTGICAYGNAVCCGKEHRLHKILGSYPSEYYMAEYQIEGVRAGCSRCMTIINEVLYYNGARGVYAYTGGTPQRIGDAIAPSPMYAPAHTVGGTDGRRWYLSGKRWDNEYELLVYDTVTGLWIREDGTHAAAFFNDTQRLHFLDDDGDIWRIEEQEWDENTEWYAEFAPIDETWGAGSSRLPVIRKYYIRLDLRLDMTEGSSVKVEVREDGGAWRTVHATDTAVDVAKRVTIQPRRCDRFSVRISGKGYVVLRAMTREYLTGSERT